MALLESCLERAVALAAGAVWLSWGNGGNEASVAVAAGAVGLATVFTSAVRRHGPESISRLKALTARVAAELEPDIATLSEAADLDIASRRLAALLDEVFPDKTRLAALTRDPRGFPVAATELILAEIASRDPLFSAGPSAVLARAVISSALEEAFTNRDYFEDLQPHLWREAMASLGRLEAMVNQLIETMGLVAAPHLSARALAAVGGDSVIGEVALSQAQSRLATGTATSEELLAALQAAAEQVTTAATALQRSGGQVTVDRLLGQLSGATRRLDNGMLLLLGAMCVLLVMVTWLVWRAAPRSPPTSAAASADAEIRKVLPGVWGQEGCTERFIFSVAGDRVTMRAGGFESAGRIVSIAGDRMLTEAVSPREDRGKLVEFRYQADPAGDRLIQHDRTEDVQVVLERCAPLAAR